MTGQDLVRASRDGDQFHYVWAARQCLSLLPGVSDLVAVSIEGASTTEAQDDAIEAGDELIDVGLYYGCEKREEARLIRYIQLKHSTRRADEVWTASGLESTIYRFARRYEELVQRQSQQDVEQRIRFEFTTNRPISDSVDQTIFDIASAAGHAARHPVLFKRLVEFTGLSEQQAAAFFRLFSVFGGEGNLWEQRNSLGHDVRCYLAGADSDAPVQLKDLVARKATTEFESDPSIRQHDVLRALNVTEADLLPAPSLMANAFGTLAREQEQVILDSVLSDSGPLVIHADGGVGKSILAARLALAVPPSSVAVLYDCFGDGLYRNSLHFRHRHQDALVQIANQLAGQGLCHPLIPSRGADAKQYIRAFVYRLAQAAGSLQATDPAAVLCLIIDAADNAEMVAQERGDSESFVRDLIRTTLPAGVRLVMTCRSHRRDLLNAPPGSREIELCPFSMEETARHLRATYPHATDAQVREFATFSTSNPRVQALALSRELELDVMLKELGPVPNTVDDAISELLDRAVACVRDEGGAIEAGQIDLICQGLATLRPLIPISVLAQLSGTSEATVRSFALDIGTPLLLKGGSLHFRDEPTETWFRENFRPEPSTLSTFLDRLRPVANRSSYAASVLPELMLGAGAIEELVELALSGEGLPSDNPIARRDVELRRLTFALKACLEQTRYTSAAKLALKAGAECAGEQRQNQLIQSNTDLAAIFMSPDGVEEIVSRRTFGSRWLGSHHAYEAGLLSGIPEFSAEASSRVRMALDWLRTWARLPEDERGEEPVSEEDCTELAMALHRLRSADEAAEFLRGWKPRYFTFQVGRRFASRLVDLGQYGELGKLATAAGNDVWLLLAIAMEARVAGAHMPDKSLLRLIRLLADRRVRLQESKELNSSWSILEAVCSAVELASRDLSVEHETLGQILERYLPSTPPSELSYRYGANPASLLRAYALHAGLRSQALALADVAPPEIREQLESKDRYGRRREVQTFVHQAGGLLPWAILLGKAASGESPRKLVEEIEAAKKETSAANADNYYDAGRVWQRVAILWLQLLRDVGGIADQPQKAFDTWRKHLEEPLSVCTLISLCRIAARSKGWEAHALEFATEASDVLEKSREDAEFRVDSYMDLARAIYTVSSDEAAIYFDRAIEIASFIGDENLDRWSALLNLAAAAGRQDRPRPETAYRLSRVAELTYEYVARDKHFDWTRTVEGLISLCAPSSLAVLSRWRDRRFGDWRRLIPLAIYQLVDDDKLPVKCPIALAGLNAGWNRLEDLKRALVNEGTPQEKQAAAEIAYRYMRISSLSSSDYVHAAELGKEYGLQFADVERLSMKGTETITIEREASPTGVSAEEPERRSPNWDDIFEGVELTDVGSIEAAYAAMRTYDPPYEFDVLLREALARVGVGRESQLIRSLAASPSFGVFQLQDLIRALPSPLPRHAALRKAVREAVLIACQREPTRVYRRGWGSMICFKELDEEGIAPDGDVVGAMLNGYLKQVDQLTSGDLFQLLDPLAACLAPDEAGEALDYGLNLLEDTLRPDDGDGSWRDELLPPTLIQSVAGYIWSGLGSPVASERWQFAHVVRSCAELGWDQLLGSLIAFARSGQSAPFTDSGLHFYSWHALQWLLIGLARGVKERPTASVVPFLKECLAQDHVLIREIAAQGLRVLAKEGALAEIDASVAESPNRSALEEVVYTSWSDCEEHEAAGDDEDLTDDEKYYFGIDIGPYWFAPLGRAFGLSQDAIERRVRSVLRRTMNWMGGGLTDDARYKRGIFGEGETHHSHGTLPGSDNLCAYNSYHAMMIVAATLLNERSVRRRAEADQDDFHEWMNDYLHPCPDWTWLSDRRDPRLVADPASEGHSDGTWRWSISADYIDSKLATDDGQTVLWGDWSSGQWSRRESISVRSVLVSRCGATALVAALQTAPDLSRHYLPRAEEGDLELGPLRLTGWVSDNQVSNGLDAEDHWAGRLNYPGPGPSQQVCALLELKPSADGRLWTVDSGILRLESWSQLEGIDREEAFVTGTRLSANQEFLDVLLKRLKGQCLVLEVSVIRHRPQHQTDEGNFNEYSWPNKRYFMMEEDGVPRAL